MQWTSLYTWWHPSGERHTLHNNETESNAPWGWKQLCVCGSFNRMITFYHEGKLKHTSVFKWKYCAKYCEQFDICVLILLFQFWGLVIYSKFIYPKCIPVSPPTTSYIYDLFSPFVFHFHWYFLVLFDNLLLLILLE